MKNWLFWSLMALVAVVGSVAIAALKIALFGQGRLWINIPLGFLYGTAMYWLFIRQRLDL